MKNKVYVTLVVLCLFGLNSYAHEGPDGGYRVGGSIRDVQAARDSRTEIIRDVTELPGYKMVVVPQLAAMYRAMPQIPYFLLQTVNKKIWYWSKFSDSMVPDDREEVRIGRQDETEVYLSDELKSPETSEKIRLQGELILHEMWIGYAGTRVDQVEQDRPNQLDVEKVNGVLLANPSSITKPVLIALLASNGFMSSGGGLCGPKEQDDSIDPTYLTWDNYVVRNGMPVIGYDSNEYVSDPIYKQFDCSINAKHETVKLFGSVNSSWRIYNYDASYDFHGYIKFSNIKPRANCKISYSHPQLPEGHRDANMNKYTMIPGGDFYSKCGQGFNRLWLSYGTYLMPSLLPVPQAQQSDIENSVHPGLTYFEGTPSEVIGLGDVPQLDGSKIIIRIDASIQSTQPEIREVWLPLNAYESIDLSSDGTLINTNIQH